MLLKNVISAKLMKLVVKKCAFNHRLMAEPRIDDLSQTDLTGNHLRTKKTMASRLYLLELLRKQSKLTIKKVILSKKNFGVLWPN